MRGLGDWRDEPLRVDRLHAARVASDSARVHASRHRALRAADAPPPTAFFEKHCFECHDADTKKGDSISPRSSSTSRTPKTSRAG